MWTDPIVAEVRKVREEYARRFGYDLTRIIADLRKSAKKRAEAGAKPAPARKRSSKTATAQPVKATKRKRRAA